MEFLSRRTDTLERALMKGADTLIQRATRTAEAALEAVEKSIRIVAAKEEWTTERRDQMLGEKQGPVRELLKRATDGRRAAAIAEWIGEVREVVPDVRQQAKEVIEEKSTDYTRKEVDFFMQ